MLTDDQKTAWDRDGFFIEKAIFSKEEMDALNDEVIAKVRADPPSDHMGKGGPMGGYPIGKGLVVLETNLGKEGMRDAV